MKRTIVLITIVTMIAIAGSMVWAGPGRGYGPGGGPGGYDCPNRVGATTDLTDDQKTQLEAANKAFYEATNDLRREMRSKRFALKSVLTQKEIDVDKAKALQTEISQLRSEMGLKRIDHIVNLRKIDPDLQADMGRGFGGRGWGRHQGRGMGNGPKGPGYGRFGGGGCGGNFQGPRGGSNY